MTIYAKQPVYYLVKNHPEKIKTLYLAKDIDKKDYSYLKNFNFELKRIPRDAATKIAKTSNHQGFVAEVDDIELKDYRDFLDYNFVIILSNITDVGNIGSIVRTSYALGVDAVIACGVKTLNLASIARVSTGALFDMPFSIEQNIYDVLNDFKTSGFGLYGADMDGEDVKDAVFEDKKVLVLGSEGEGLSKKVVSKLTKTLKISMKHNFDSLNVAVAGAILIDRMR